MMDEWSVTIGNPLFMKAINRREFVGVMGLGALGLTRVSAADVEKKFEIIGFTKPFQELNHEQAAETVAAIGWDGIECPIRPKGQIEPDAAAEELPRLIDALKQHGKSLTVTTTGIKSANRESERLLRLFAKLGIKRYRLGSFSYTDKKPVTDQITEVAAALKDLAALNREVGITG